MKGLRRGEKVRETSLKDKDKEKEVKCSASNSSILMDELRSAFGVYGSGPSPIWLWCIEYLSKIPEINSSIIHALMQEAPLSPDKIDERTNERVALKCLEEMFGFKQELKNVAPPNSRTFDHSLSCQDVLKQILTEVPTFKRAGPEPLKWDMWPFIMHKRSTLPKCKLEELKASIMEKNYNVSIGNSEKSDQEDILTLLLAIKDCGVDGNQEGGLAPLRTTGNGENGNQEGGYLTPQSTMKDNEDLQDRLPENVMMVESNDDENPELHTRPSANAGENTDQGSQFSSPSSSSAADMDFLWENDDEVFNIALLRRARQDAVEKNGTTKQNICVRCNQNGQLLTCSSSDCPILIHESCLDLEASFDDKGHHYCPFCAASLFISEYLEAKKSCSIAAKKLAEFMSVFPKNPEELRKLKSQITEVDSHISSPKEGPACTLNMPEPIGSNPSSRNTETVPVEGDTVKGAVDPQSTDPRQEPLVCTLNRVGFEYITISDDELMVPADS